MNETRYQARAAQEAEAMGYGDRSYWDYLERHSQELAGYFSANGDAANAVRMLTESLADALRGNDGD